MKKAAAKRSTRRSRATAAKPAAEKRAPRRRSKRDNRQPIILACSLCPGDVLTLTAAVESLAATYPGEYAIDTRTPCPDVWAHNPHIEPIDDDRGRRIEMHYTDDVDRSNQLHLPFLAGYTRHLGRQLDRPLELTTNRPHLYLGAKEPEWIDQVHQHRTLRKVPFWLIDAGTKSDFTAKQWPVENYQQVVDATRGWIQWVQIGEAAHDHPTLDGVIDFRGETDLRQLIRLAYHAAGGLGPVTLLQHIMAAWSKPYVCLVGGREPATWVHYPRQITLHTVGALGCCRDGACWRSRVVRLDDGGVQDGSLCAWPLLGGRRPVAKCMALIEPKLVVDSLRLLEPKTGAA